MECANFFQVHHQKSPFRRMPVSPFSGDTSAPSGLFESLEQNKWTTNKPLPADAGFPVWRGHLRPLGTTSLWVKHHQKSPFRRMPVSPFGGDTSAPSGLFESLEQNKWTTIWQPILFCVPRGTRTLDPLIKSQLLYQLS